jgi:hypothetical protein
LENKNNFYVIALETPQNPAYQNTELTEKNGILRSKAPDMIKTIQISPKTILILFSWMKTKWVITITQVKWQATMTT